MPPDGRDAAAASTTQSSSSPARHFFSVPPPIKRVFDKFPLTTYPPNDIPQRFPAVPGENRLFVFTDAAGAQHGRPSFNPQCLKWQVRL